MTQYKNDSLTHKDVTPETLFMNRRQIIKRATALGGLAALTPFSPLAAKENDLKPNTYEEITSYNNYYEFGTGKDDPARYAQNLQITPWSIEIGGLVEKPGTYALGELLQNIPTHDRIYRFRCVEAWSMVIPWNGVELGDILRKAGIKSDAKYVAFETAVQPENMIGVRQRALDFPYVEGLRLDEAMHPLTLMATGIYNKPIAKQNGAPIRLVVPWKYGFKSIKSIVKITLTDREPPTTWNKASSREYGFYSNVNPNVDHPRWSQKTERRIGSSFFANRIDTLMFNGYEKEVASLYKGMDLNKYF